MNRITIAALAALVVTGCTPGQVATPPAQQTVDVSQATNALQFAVGTATIAGVGTGLNTVVTWRQPNGLDGTLYDNPTITGPSGFVNNGPAAAPASGTAASKTSNCVALSTPGTDAGTALISGAPQTTLGVAAPAGTFGNSGGAFAYGFQPANTTASSNSANFARYCLPALIPAATTYAPVPYIGGPPAYPNVRNGTYPAGFNGYPMGFTDFAVAPVAGNYALSLSVPTGFDKNGNPTTTTATASAALTNTTPLAAITGVTFTPDGAGGGTVSATISDPRITEAAAIVRVTSGGACYPSASGVPVYYTTRVTAINTAGVTTFPAIPPNIGPTYSGVTSSRSLCTGDTAQVYVVGFDYPAFAAGPPQNTQKTPTITGAGGQADISTSAVVTTAALP